MNSIYPTKILDELCQIKGGKRLPKGEVLIDEVTQHPYIRARDIRNGKVIFDDPKYISQEVHEKIKRYIVNEDDVIITIVGANTGDVAYISNDFDKANLTENAVKLTANKSLLHPKYLLYALLPSYMKGYFQLIASGAAQEKLGLYKIKKVPIPLPELTQQTKIAEILSAYDDLIENNLKRIKLLEEMAQITYEEWFVRMKFPGHETAVFDEETGLPEGWEKGTCLDFIDVMSGGTPKTNIEEFWDGSIKFFTPKDANSGFFTGETEKTITPLGLSKCNSKLYGRNTVFITARGTVGKLNLAREPMAMNQSCYALKGRNYESPYFVFGAMSSAIGAVKGAANGGVFDAIVVDTFKYLPFIKPKSELVEVYEATVKPMFESISNLMDQIEFLKEARDILLPRLMTGMIDIEEVELPEAMLIRLEQQEDKMATAV